MVIFRSIVFAGFLLALVGCGVRPFIPDASTHDEIATATLDHTGTVKLKNGQKFSGKNIEVHRDSVHWLVEATNSYMGVRTDDVHSISISSPQMLSGVLIGMPLGGILGAIAGHASYTPPAHPGLFNFGDAAATFTGLCLGGLLGGVGGGLIGEAHRVSFVAGAK